MTLDPGDETHLNADYLPLLDSGTVQPGEPTMINNNGEVVPLTEGQQYTGVYQIGDTGDKCTVKVQGSVIAYVDSSVKKGQHIGSPDVAGGEAQKAFGTKDDQNVIVLEPPHEYKNSGRFVANVLLR